MKRPNPHPKVLCLSGHDATGGAGVHADIETIAALGGHALSVITAYTVQDTRDVRRVVAPPLEWFRAQLDTLLRDVRPDAIKVGLLGDARQVAVIERVIRTTRVPVVVDPVLRAGGGRNLAGAALLEGIRRLAHHADVVTPNQAEVLRLAPRARSLDEAAGTVLALGAGSVLVTGGNAPGRVVANAWYRPRRAPQRFAWPRLAGTRFSGGFHGAGCTLAAAIAVLLARGFEPAAAVQDAQAFTHAALARGRRIGRGRAIPWRKADA